jgi:hypothetical protein
MVGVGKEERSAMTGQINSQLIPQRAPGTHGLGAAAVMSLAAGGTATVTASADTLVSVTVQSFGYPVAVSYTAGVKSVVPFSCPDPCQFILDGNPGSITFTWQGGMVQTTATLNIVAPVAPPPKTNPKTPTPAPIRWTEPNLTPAQAAQAKATLDAANAAKQSSSKTAYYVAGGAAVVAIGGAAYWKYGRKRR